MPSPKSGKAGKAVPPVSPDKAEDADVADPGKVAEIKAEQQKTKSGKYGSQQVKPFKPPAGEEEAKAVEEGKEQTKEEKKEELSWIEIELMGANGQPIPGEKYKITLPDDSVAEGTLDSDGLARIEGIKSGNCRITFPDLDGNSWEKA